MTPDKTHANGTPDEARGASQPVDAQGDPLGDPTVDGWHWTPARVLGAAALGAMALFWAWIFALGGSSVQHNDEMNDTTFAAAAEPICAAAQAEIGELPIGSSVETFDERADLIDSASDRLSVMIDDLATVPRPPDAEESRIVGEWLIDYDRFVGDRRAYSDQLRSGDDGPIRLSARDGRRITNYIVTFAEVNNMFSCVPPGDV